MASSRRRRSTIAALSLGDRTATNLPGKVELATGYFMGLMGSAQPREADISLAAVGLGPIDLYALEAQFMESEVWDALRAMPANKSPGPDGFTWEFYRRCWPVVKGDVLAALRAIWMGRDQGFEALNEALITLLPKKDGAVDLKDFRPISLVHSFARLLAKVLARRLGPKMDLLVAPNQTAFIRGRCIQDNFLLVKESAKLLHRKRIPALLLKVDIAKAFDSISWSFLLSVLRQRGFGPRWLRWIAMLLRSASTSVLVNGFAGDAFRHGRGLRQGDPISPLLFVIAMDVLLAMFAAVEGAGVISNLADVGLRHRVSLFADDMVIFAKPDAHELAAIWEVLACFGAASGLRANPNKSFAAPIRCSADALQGVAAALTCPLGSLPCTYLGLPLSLQKPRKAELQAVLDKLPPSSLSGRPGCCPGKAASFTFRQFMSASVVYQLLALDLDPWFIKAVDKLRRGFLWAGSEDAKGGCCAVAWHLVCQPKALGGLGLRNLRLMNIALRTHWLWLQRTCSDKPWFGLDPQVSDHAIGLFNASVIIKVGNGSSLLFWEDAWIDGLTVATIAPEVIKLVRPTARCRRTVQQGRVANSWALDISGQLSVDAVVQYLHLWTDVHRVLGATPAASEEDSFRWKWSADGSFSSNGAYRVLFHGTVGLPAANLVWDSFVPLKYRMHAWLALRRRCWMADRRLRRGLPSHSLCPLCTATDETLDHLSLHCRYAQDLWAGLVARLRLPNIAPVAAVGINDW
ncbi:hypothetical protein ACQ4PT_012221 [Festuca glaucescens]